MIADAGTAGPHPTLSEPNPQRPVGTGLKPLLRGSCIALLALMIAVALRWALTPWLGTRAPYITMFPAVAVAVWYGGRLPAIVAALLGYLAIDFAIVESPAVISVAPSRLASFSAYILSCGIIIGFGDGMRSSRRRLQESEQGLQRQLEALTKLHELSLRLAVTDRLSTALSAILRTLADIHRAPRGVLSLYDAESGVLREAASVGFDERAREPGGELSPGVEAGACVRAFATGRRAIVFDVETDSSFQQYRGIARFIGFRAVHSTPIVTLAGEILGVISLYFSAPRDPDELEIQFSDMCARHAAEAVESRRNRQALEESEQRLRRQSAELEQQLIASGRLVSIGEITASLAHEFNNPLGIMLGFAQDLRSEKTPDHPDYRPLTIIYEEGRRCQKIVADLLEFSRPRKAQLRETPPGELIDKALSFVSPRLHRQGIQVSVVVDAGVAKLVADPVQMGQVLVNLYLNALDAMPDGGALTVRVARSPADGQATIQISVADTGSGIAQESLGRIFHPFFTEKKRTGLGLGLPLCQRIVENHGGTIDVASELNRGTTFTIRLPEGGPVPSAADGAYRS